MTEPSCWLPPVALGSSSSAVSGGSKGRRLRGRPWPPGVGRSACRPTSLLRCEARLAARAPVEHAVVLTRPPALDRFGAAEAALAAAAVDGEPAGTPGRRPARRGVRFARSSRAATLTRRVASGSGTSLDRRERTELACPQNLAPVHVADSAEHALVEQHLADRGARIVVGEQQLDASVEVGVDPAQVRAEPAEAGMARQVRRAERLDHRRVEAHRFPATR